MATVVDSTSAASTGTSWTVNRPTGYGTTWGAGDILIAHLEFDSGSFAAGTLPTGFRFLFGHNRGDSTNGIKFKVGYKVATGSESATYAFGQAGGSDGVATVHAITGAQAAFIWSLDTRANATTQIAPSIARFSASDLLLCGAGMDGSGSGISWTAPGGMTELEDLNSGGFTTASVASLAAPSNPTGSKSFTASASGSGGAVTWSLVIADVAATVTGIRPVVEAGEVQDIAAATSTAVPLQNASQIAAGNYLIARLALDNSGASGAATTVSVSDPRSNTWTVTAAANRTAASAANDGTTCYIAYAKVTNAYTDGDSITFNYGNSTTANAIVIEEWAGIDGTTPLAVAATTATGSSTTPSVSRTPTAVGQLFYGALAVEGPEGDAVTQDADTTDGVWSGLPRVVTISGTAASNQCTAGAWKVATGTSAQTWNPTLGTSRDWAQVALVFAPAVSGVTASAGTATATAASNDATTTVAATPTEATATATAANPTGLTATTAAAATATGSGTAETPTGLVAASAQQATATAAAQDPTTATTASPTTATAAAAALDATGLTAAVAPATEATATAAAQDATGLVSASAEIAAATAAAQDPTATTSVVAPAAEATASATALDPTGLTAAIATPTDAAATGAALAPAGLVSGSPDVAGATAAAQDATTAVVATAQEATATATANDATATGGSAATAPAGEASATATADDPSVAVTATPAEATASAVALDPTTVVSATPSTATTAGAALDPATTVSASPSTAAASAAALDAVASTDASAVAFPTEATATATALDPTGLVAANPVEATATAATQDATVAIVAIPVEALATATANDATGVTGGAATALAQVASAVAAALDPVVLVVVSPEVASATAAANNATGAAEEIPDGGVVLRVKEITAQLESYVLRLGVLESVNGGELRHMKGQGLRAALWFDRIEPIAAASGMEFVTVRLEMKIRIYGNVQAEPSDEVEPEMLSAVDAVMNAFAEGYTLEDEVRDVDLYGAHGQRFSAQAGYQDIQEGTCRVETITVPLIVNDVWQLVA